MIVRRERGLQCLLIGIACAVLLGLAVVPGSAQAEPTERIVIELESDGDATLTTAFTYDLADESEHRAFEAIEADPSAQTATYHERLQGVAAQVAADEGREMSVREPRATVERVDGVGVVEFAVTWTNLAAVEGDRLVLSAPLDDQFQPDRPLVVRAPEGYAIDESAVSPSEQSGQEARWNQGNDLSGFSATMAPSSDALSLPLAVPIAGLLLATGGLAARRRTMSTSRRN